MSDTESEGRRSPGAFEEESSQGSSSEGGESTDSGSSCEIVERARVHAEAGATSTRVHEDGEPSTSGREADGGGVSVAAPGEGVLRVVRGRQRIPMAKPLELVFGVDDLEPNTLTESELAKIRSEYNIPESIEGALDATPLPKRPRGPNEGTSVQIPDDEEGEEGPVNIACPRKAVPFVNCVIDGAQMELSEIEQLSKKTLREQTGRAFRLQAAANMDIWLCAKRAVNAAERHQKRFEECRSKVADGEKLVQEAGRLAEQNAAKIAELSSKVAATELELLAAQEAKVAVEVALDAAERSHGREVEEAKVKAVADYRMSEEFTLLVDKEVMEQCDDFVYRFKWYNADKRLNLNFLRDPPPLPEGVTEEMVEAYKGEDAEPAEADDTESSSGEDEGHPAPNVEASISAEPVAADPSAP
ncbi:hypothetical protein ACE6H2_012492 [Prunus campanulata]